jgi:TolB-like protein/DNA-binding winged helix-turn-helix (wHTH) protein/thioredoxin-like negative regulator of GroEL
MIYEFSDLTLDLERHLLTRGGRPIKLTKLSFKVLQALVQAAPAMVSHDDLIDQVWGPNRVITPDNLSQRMKTLRQSLGDDPNQPIYIEGVRGEGYRLVPEVKTLSTQAPSRSSRQALSTRFLVSLALLALALVYIAFDWFLPGSVDNEHLAQSASQEDRSAVPGETYGGQSIAVLPFINLSSESSNQFFADGLHDDLLTRISNIQNIKTISRTSVMPYRNSSKTLRSIAKELRVSTILEGGVQRAGDQVRINLQLIDAESDAHIWAQTYTRELSATNVFLVQAEITEAVAEALQTVLSDDERKQVRKLPTTNLQALDAYFLGNQLFSQATSESVAQAILAYQAAIALDPEFALAYSKQASAVLAQVSASGLPNEAQLAMSRPLIDQAILLDPLSSEAFIALGGWYRRSGDVEKALQAYEQAMALGPNNADALAAYGSMIQSEMSDPAAAIKLIRKATELDPQNIDLKRKLARAMPSVGRADEGIKLLESIVAEHPDSAVAYRDLAILYSNWEFRHDKGIRVLRRAFELDPKHPPNSYMNAIMHWRLGDYDNTALWMNHIARLVPNPETARVYRGWAFIAQRNFESARGEFERPDLDVDLYWLGVFYLGNVDTAQARPGDAIERYKHYAAEFDGEKSNVNLYYGISAIKAYRALGEQEKAQALTDKLLATLNASPSLGYHDSAIHDASIYALAGQEETAIATLEEWVRRGGATSLLEQDIRHGLGVLTDDPRYQSILRTVNSRLSEQKTNLARWEASGDMPPIPSAVIDPR